MSNGTRTAEVPSLNGALRFSNDWFSAHEPHWNDHLVRLGQTGQPLHLLEIGSFEGRSSCWFLTHLMGHPESRLTCVDPWLPRDTPENMEEVFATFQHNVQATGEASRVSTRRGRSTEILPSLPDHSFNLIYVDGDHSAAAVRADSLEAFRLLQPGGLLLWDDYYWSDSVKAGVDQACAQLGITVTRFGNNASFVKPKPVAALSREPHESSAPKTAATPPTVATLGREPHLLPSPRPTFTFPGQKIVALVPARNEGPRIAFCLRALARFADAIVYLDDCSDDQTVAIVESLAAECRVEKIIRKTAWLRDEPGDRNALLQAGRALGGTHFIVLDADEAFTANCAEHDFLRRLIFALRPGDSLALNWIQLWRNVHHYRFDQSVWTWNAKPIIFRDDGKCSYSSEFIHTPRVPGNLSGRCHAVPGYAHGLLHFQFVHWRNLQVKQAWYRCLEHIREPNKPVAAINARYAPSKDETDLGLKAAPAEWLAGYPFFDRAIVADAEMWREQQILGWFEEFGREHFRQLDIWDIPWGQTEYQTSPPLARCPVRAHRLPEEIELATNLIQKIQASLAANQLPAARAALMAILRVIPDDPDLTVVHGNVLATLGDREAARWEYVRALALNPNHAGAMQSLQTLLQSDQLLVSAIVSTYNSERFMRGCLENLTGQTLFTAGKLEIIVVDAGSAENERAIVEGFQKRFPNIAYLRTEERETIYAAWNRAVAVARGRYLTSANTDDRHRPDALAVMAVQLEAHPEIALVYADQLITTVPNDTFANTQACTRWNWPAYSYAELERRCIVGSQPLWRRDLHKKHGLFQAKFRSAGDYEFWLRIGKTEKFHRVPEILGLYYHNPAGMEIAGGCSAAETKEVLETYGILARKVQPASSIPVPISAAELNALPGRSSSSPGRARSPGAPRESNKSPSSDSMRPPLPTAGFNPANPDYRNTPASPLRPARAYLPLNPAAPPVVTIITPFFNTGEIFQETARTVLAQTFQQWEWLIINDASTSAEAKQVLGRFRKADPRIKVVDQSSNSGPGAARNRGAQLAAGEFIVLLDSDDLLEPTALEKWLWFLDAHPEFAFVKGFSVGFGAKNYLWNNGFHQRQAFLQENLADLTSMLRKSAFLSIGGYAEDMRHGFEDWEFWLRSASHGQWGATIPEYFDWYRRREDHSDRWSNWDSGERQRQSRAQLQTKYQGLAKTFPAPQPPPLHPGTPPNLSVPAANELQKTKPRVLMLLPWMTLGGADKFNLDLVGQLTNRGWEVTIAGTQAGDNSWMPEFCRFTPDVFFLPNFLPPADFPRFLCYLIESRQIDTVVLSHSILGYQLLPYLRSRFPKLAIVDYCHIEEENWIQGGYPKLSVQNAPSLDVSVVSSEHLKRWMVARSADPAHVEVCYTNINAKEWEPDPATRSRVRSQLQLSDEHPVILYAGRVVAQKQPRVLAEAMRLLRDKNSNFTVLVAGDGPDLPWVKEFVTQHKLADNVRFLGAVPNERIRELMRASDIFFLPSQWEGIALSIFEAMASGLAVVGADVGGQRELVTPGCGHLLPPGAPASAYAKVLAPLVKDLAQARALGNAARQRVIQQFALDQMGERMAALCQQARQRRAAASKSTIAPEIGEAALAEIVEMSRLQRYINTALDLAKKHDWCPALRILEHVQLLARHAQNGKLVKDLDTVIAQFRNAAGLVVASPAASSSVPKGQPILARQFIAGTTEKNEPRPEGTAAAAPLVSVIIPCYNYAHLLPEAVESVISQTFQNFEIIIVNDGSTDNTVAVANALIQKHSPKHRVQLITQPNSGQPAAARNTGIRAATGEFILPLDADDKIAPTFLEKTVAVLKSSSEIGVAFTHIQHFGAINSVYATGPFKAAVLARDNVMPYCSLYRRQLWEEVGGYRLMGYEDWDFWLTLAERGCRGRLVPEPLFCYRKHGQGMLNQDNAKRERLIAQIVANHPKLYPSSGGRKTAAILVPEEQRTPAPQSTSGSPDKNETCPKETAATAPITRPPMRITYLISSILGVTGGNQTLLNQAEEMRRRGHQVTIVTYSPKPSWFNFAMTVIQVPAGKAMAPFVPPSDVVVATYFINAPELRSIQAPVKAYYAQGDQFVFGDATMADTPQNRQFRELSSASYQMPGIRFVPNSHNLANAVEKMCGRKPDGILPVCTDQTIFRPLQRSIPGSRFRLLIVGPDSRGTAAEPLLFKGMQDIHDALQIVQREYPHFTAVRMSATPPDIFARMPCEFYIAPSDEMKTMLFGTAHIHIYASHYDSCPRPPQEAMAAGCAVICTATSGAMEYCRDGENSLLVPIQSPVAIAAAVQKLIHDHALRNKLVQGGLATAHEFPREREWNEWENLLYRFQAEASTPIIPILSHPPISSAERKETRKEVISSPTAITLPACALVGHLGPARELLKQKKLAPAWATAIAAVEARPFHPEGFLLLAEIAHTAGDGASAMLCAKHARSLAPDWKPAKKFLSGNHRGANRPAWLVLPGAIADCTKIAPRLTVCLITKNEEKFLGRCLESVRSLANQIIVVDTGSTDRTIEIAREHGAQVHHFTWCDDFATARNAALEHATGDWILSLDADEELQPGQAQTISADMQTAGVLACRLPIVDVGREKEGCSFVPRLFRNAPGLFFLGRVHEQAFSSIEVRCREWKLQHVLGKTTLLHHGYTPEIMQSRGKVERNLRLLEKAIAELPDEPNLLMSLGLELMRSGRRAEGLRRYWEAVALLDGKPADSVTPELRETLLQQLTTHLLAGKEFSEVVRLWEMPAVKSGARCASHHFGLGLALLELQRPADAAEQMKLCVAKRALPALSPVNAEIRQAGPNHCLALCLAATGENEAAEAAFASALVDNPASRQARFDFARFLAATQRPLVALEHLNRLVAADPSDAPAWQFGGQIALSRPEFLAFASDFTGEAIKHHSNHPAVVALRAETLFLTQDFAAALPLFQQSPGTPRDLAALLLCAILTDCAAPPLSAAAEPPVSREMIKWYRQLIAVGADSAIHQLHERMEQVRAVAPGFARVWDAATKQARQTMAAA